MANGDKETVTLKLPTGEMVDFVVPGGLSDNEVKAFVMSKRPDLFATQPGTIGPPPQKQPITSPIGLGEAMAGPIRDYVTQAQNLTPQGAAEHPVQAAIGKAAGFLLGGSQGIGTEHGGVLTNPVMGAIMGVGPGGSAAEAAASRLPSATAAAARAEAGATIGQIRTVAGKIPVNTANFGDSLLELFTQKGYGAQFPTPARELLKRLTAKNAPPLTLEEAKGFQSQVTDFLKNPVGANGARIKDENIFRLMGQLNQGLKASIEEGAQLGGFEPGTFTGAMKQFSDAASKEAMIQRLHDLAMKGIKIGAGAAIGGAGAHLGYDIYKIYHPKAGKD